MAQVLDLGSVMGPKGPKGDQGDPGPVPTFHIDEQGHLIATYE